MENMNENIIYFTEVGIINQHPPQQVILFRDQIINNQSHLASTEAAQRRDVQVLQLESKEEALRKKLEKCLRKCENMNFNAVEATNKFQKCIRKWDWDGDIRRFCFRSLGIPSTDRKAIAYSEIEANSTYRLRILEELCRKGADVRYLESERGFALIPRVFYSIKLIKFFIDKFGMDVNSRHENDGDTALHKAIHLANSFNPSDDSDCITNYRSLIKWLLLESSADPNVANLLGDTALFKLINCRGDVEIARMLLESGANVTTINSNGQFILHLNDSWRFKDVLIEVFDGDIDARTSSWLYSKTPLMVAAERENVELCKMLIERGADINAKDLQGYTALHHAGLSHSTECADVLVKVGADPNIKSASGKDVYDVNILNLSCYSTGEFGATPKQAELHEISAAIDLVAVIFAYDDDRICIEMWDRVLEFCKTHNLQPSQEFLANNEFIRQNHDNPGAYDEIIKLAFNTVYRLSHGTSTFWNMLALLTELEVDSNKFRDSHSCFSQFLDILSKEFERAEDLISFEEADINVLYHTVRTFDDWFKELTINNESTQKMISVFYSLANLIIACFNKLMQETKSKTIFSNNMEMETCIVLCHSLMSLHLRFNRGISIPGFNETENKQLLRNLFELDARDSDLNSLIHLILKFENITKFIDEGIEFKPNMVLALLDFEFVKVTNTRNRSGFEPFQCINWGYFDVYHSEDVLAVFEKMAKKGAHVDATNIDSRCEAVLMEVFKNQISDDVRFRYDSLQCACARVLARSLVPYRNMVPKRTVDFISKHYEHHGRYNKPS